VLRACLHQQLRPQRLVILPSTLHRRTTRPRSERIVRGVARAGAVPGLNRLAARGVAAAFRPATGEKLSARGNPAARDLMRHALADLPRNGNRAQAWAKAVRRWPVDEPADILDGYRHLDCPVLLLWADADQAHPLAIAEEALDLLPDAQLRILPGTGYLMAYDDPVGMAREIAAFCL
jgi:pimeloyl-ACP methyl ester carboxylesterase